MARMSTFVLVGAATVFGAVSPAQADPVGAVDPIPAEVPTAPGPAQVDHGQAAIYARNHPGSIPAGLNDFRCKPTAEHPYPVVLAHGTDSTAYSDWAGLAPHLVAGHYCAFALNYGGKPGATSFGDLDMHIGGQQLAAFVDRVLAATGASRVDLVGFSQGATVTRYYVNRLNGAPKVHQWIGLASPSYGGIFYGLVPVVQALPFLQPVVQALSSLSVVQQEQGSPFLDELNAGSDTVPGVEYTTIGSRVDEMIQPYTNVALRSPGARNILIQDLCPADLTGHFNMPYDRFAQQLVLNALDPTTPVTPDCAPVALGTGILSVIIAAHT